MNGYSLLQPRAQGIWIYWIDEDESQLQKFCQNSKKWSNSSSLE